MTIGDDIADVLGEVGSAFTILRDSGNVTGEYCEIILNAQVTKPFIFSYFREVTLQHDTEAVSGDVLEFAITGDRFLLMSANAEEFQNEIVTMNGVLYGANVSGELLRPSGERWPNQTYHKEQGWEVIKDDCYALLTESLYGHELNTDEEIGQLELQKNEMYIPASVGIQVGDRYRPVSGEHLKVETIKPRRYKAVAVCQVVEDTR